MLIRGERCRGISIIEYLCFLYVMLYVCICTHTYIRYLFTYTYVYMHLSLYVQWCIGKDMHRHTQTAPLHIPVLDPDPQPSTKVMKGFSSGCSSNIRWCSYFKTCFFTNINEIPKLLVLAWSFLALDGCSLSGTELVESFKRCDHIARTCMKDKACVHKYVDTQMIIQVSDNLRWIISKSTFVRGIASEIAWERHPSQRGHR